MKINETSPRTLHGRTNIHAYQQLTLKGVKKGVESHIFTPFFASYIHKITLKQEGTSASPHHR